VFIVFPEENPETNLSLLYLHLTHILHTDCRQILILPELDPTRYLYVYVTGIGSSLNTFLYLLICCPLWQFLQIKEELNHVLSTSCAAWYLVMGPFLRYVTATVEMRSATEKLRNLSHLMTFCSQSTRCFALFVSSEHM
jgi:hypothetical protein